MPTATTIADRVSFRWWPTFEVDFPFCVEATERKSSVREVSVRYLIQEQEPVSGGRVFLVAKDLNQDVPREDEVYEVFVRPGLERCNCKGSACRRNAIRCKHKLALSYLLEQGCI